MKISLDWLQDYMKMKTSPRELAHRLTMAGLEAKVPESMGEDSILDIEITSNRPDWLSHIGVAREAAAIFRKNLHLPVLKTLSGISKSQKSWRIAIENQKLCPFYSAQLLEGVQDIPTPDFMEARLRAIGLRPVNFLVDVTNYVLMECGQPLHAFDAEKIQGDTLYIRPARKGEKLLAIDGKEYELISSDLVIADASGPVALAGVMGGKATEIGSHTQSILIESAFFDPACVRATSRRLALVSDSSYRFERRVDPEGVAWGRMRALDLIETHTSIGKISKVFSGGKLPSASRKINFSFEYLEKILGLYIPASQIFQILVSLGLNVRKQKSGASVSIPSFRPDLLEPIDLVEEVARLYGYVNIPEMFLESRSLPQIENAIFSFLDEVRDLVCGAGFDEAVNFSLIHEENLLKAGWEGNTFTRIINPQHKELSVMRPTLVQGLIENVVRNLNLGNSNLALFEIGRIYGPESAGKLPDEVWHLAAVLTGKKLLNWKDKGRGTTLYDLKGVIEMLAERLAVANLHFVESGTSRPFLSGAANLEIRLDHEPIGMLGELSEEVASRFDIGQKVFWVEMNLERLVSYRALKKEFVPFSKFPSVERDLALLVPKQVKAEALLHQIRKTSGELLRNVELFDVFESEKLPAGIKSLGVKMHFQSEERTLSAEEVHTLQEKILADLKTQFGAYLR